jgi:outer membrane protein assembly factor BamB
MQNTANTGRLSFLTAAFVLMGAQIVLSQDNGAQVPSASPLAASSFPKFRGDAHNTGRASGRPLKAVQEWSFPVPVPPYSSPAYDGEGMLFFGSDALHAVDAETGEQKWEFHPGHGTSFDATPVLGANGLIYIEASNELLYALNKQTGKVVWNYPTHSQGDPTCVVGKDGTVYAYVHPAFVALDGRTGKQKWETPAPNPNLNVSYVPASPALSTQGTVIFGGKDHKVYALDCRTGKPRWIHDMKELLIISSPAIGEDGTVYIGCCSKDISKMMALNGATGQPLWEEEFATSLITSPALGDNGLCYFGSGDQNVYALDQKSGARRWKFATGKWIQSPACIGLDGTVYIGSGDHKMYALDGRTGAKKWEYDAEDAIFSSPVLTPDGALFFSSSDGMYHALPKAKQEQLAKEQAAKDQEKDK